jgi:hypothetical protein
MEDKDRLEAEDEGWRMRLRIKAGDRGRLRCWVMVEAEDGGWRLKIELRIKPEEGG